MSLSAKTASASNRARRGLEDPKGHSKRCVMTFVADERICEAIGGTVLPLDLAPGAETSQARSMGQIARAQIADVIAEPGIADMDDPDQRKVWLWDL